MEIFFVAFLVSGLVGVASMKGEKIRHQAIQDQERIVREVLFKQTTIQKTDTKLLDDKVYQ